jgi:sugar (pentulose or hexulose) kinase
MSEIAIGVDIGTSYTKGVACAKDGTVVAAYRKPTMHVKTHASLDLQSATAWWECVKDVVRGLLFPRRFQLMNVASVCVSAIAPTLTVFDAAHPDRAYAILYSSLALAKDAARCPNLSLSNPALTKQRLTILASVARKERFISPCITDLVGYANWRLTEKLTMNGLSFAEMGITQKLEDCEMFDVSNSIPRLVAASEKIGETTPGSAGELGIESGISVSGGCPDTMSSIVGAGLTRAPETMLYLGTFGSILNLDDDVDTILDATSLPRLPYRWLLSIPGLGPEIESLAHRWFGFSPASERLSVFDQAAAKAPPGAGGTLFLVPRWKNGMTRIGGYRLVPDRSGENGNVQRQARAVLEGVAYAALCLGNHSRNPIFACGGGARSRIWLDTISTVLDNSVQARQLSWEATGTADIAARTVWKSAPERPWYTSHICTETPREVINDNYHRAMEVYRQIDWA